MLGPKRRKAVIFGVASFAEVADFYLTHDSDYEVVGFTVSEPGTDFLGRPVVPFDRVQDSFPPSDHDIFVAVGYARMNRVRERFINEAKAKGYRPLSYVCSKATRWGEAGLGENVFIFEDNTIQPFVSIADGTILWSGNHIGHHSSIGPYCFITSHVVVSGHCKVGSHCFIGVNATISENVTIGSRNLIGPAALVQKDTEDGAVYVAERAKRIPRDSGAFFK
jgi:sugar O-acyltransferase (sialic acid O-acetyltransferase NeuD family)